MHFSLRTHNKKHKSTFLGTINRIDNSIIAFRWHNWYRYTNFHVGSLHLCNNQWISLSFTSLQIPCSQHFRPGRAEDNFVFWRSFCLRKVMKSGWNLAQTCPKFRRLRQAKRESSFYAMIQPSYAIRSRVLSLFSAAGFGAFWALHPLSLVLDTFPNKGGVKLKDIHWCDISLNHTP